MPFSIRSNCPGPLGVIEADPSGRVIGFEGNPVPLRPLLSDPEKAPVDMGVYLFGRESLIETLRKNVDLDGSDDFGRDILSGLIRAGRTLFPIRWILAPYWHARRLLPDKSRPFVTRCDLGSV